MEQDDGGGADEQRAAEGGGEDAANEMVGYAASSAASYRSPHTPSGGGTGVGLGSMGRMHSSGGAVAFGVAVGGGGGVVGAIVGVEGIEAGLVGAVADAGAVAVGNGNTTEQPPRPGRDADAMRMRCGCDAGENRWWHKGPQPPDQSDCTPKAAN